MRKSAARAWQAGVVGLFALLVVALVPQAPGLDGGGERISLDVARQGSGAAPGQAGGPAQKVLARAQGEASKLRGDGLAAVAVAAGAAALPSMGAAAELRTGVFTGLLLACSRYGRAPPTLSFL